MKGNFSTPVVCDASGFVPENIIHSLLSLDPSRRAAVLDSNGARGRDARYLIAGFDPFETIEARSSRLDVVEREGIRKVIERGSSLEVLDARLDALRNLTRANNTGLPVAGACIATLAYDLAWGIDPFCLRRSHSSVTYEPHAVFALYDTLVVHDYLTGQSQIVSISGREGVEKMRHVLESPLRNDDAVRQNDESSHSQIYSSVVSNFSREEYLVAVRRIREHIFAGDIYQANLTQQFTCPLAPETTPEKIFLRLRRDHPASFAAFIRRRDDTVVSQSPERFLRVSFADGGARTIEAWPIKGTRPRGKTRAEDERLRRELQASEKDRAENVMIVDLLRNDLGRVCEYGSIEVPALWRVEEHPTLFHLVSEVHGTLRDEITASGILTATFPCGSITGAPKLRAMEIIDEVETVPRGLSMGSIGYFSFDGRIDLNVAIRTMTISRDRTARFNTGGGIVADSDPEEEYAESLVKARALLNALGADFNTLEP